MQYCSLQHRTYFHHQSHPQLSIISALTQSSFLLELLVISLHSSPVAYWTPSTLGPQFSASYLFCLFVQFMGSSQQEYWNGLPFPPPVEHILSELSTVTHWSSVTLHSLAVSFIELHKPLHHGKAVIHEGGCSHRSLKSQNQQNKLFIKKKMDAASSET